MVNADKYSGNAVIVTAKVW